MRVDLSDAWAKHTSLQYILEMEDGTFRGVPTSKYPTIAQACQDSALKDLHLNPGTKANKVQAGIEMMEAGITQYRAAQLLGISEAAISRARKLREQRGLCPHCGQLMPPSGP